MSKLQRGFTAIETLIALVVIAAITFGGYYVWHHNHKPKITTTSTAPSSGLSDYSTTSVSGKGRFTITFPAGWKVTRDTKSDFFIVLGETQPETSSTQKAAINDTNGFGTDSAVVFDALVTNPGPGAPIGTVSNFTLVNGKENPIKGKKYIYEYPKDELAGIGYQRIKGDRDYTYVFPLSHGQELRVDYSVYAQDPRNQIETIESIVQSIVLSKI